MAGNRVQTDLRSLFTSFNFIRLYNFDNFMSILKSLSLEPMRTPWAAVAKWSPLQYDSANLKKTFISDQTASANQNRSKIYDQSKLFAD